MGQGFVRHQLTLVPVNSYQPCQPPDVFLRMSMEWPPLNTTWTVIAPIPTVSIMRVVSVLP